MTYTAYVNWDGGRIKCTWLPGGAMPPEELVTSVHGICLHNGKLLLIDHEQRGGDIPGGHREPGETPEACFRREALEEGGVEGGSCTYLGRVEIDHRENPGWQPGGKYPQVGYQVYYRMDVARVLPFEAKFESTRRFFVDPEEAPRYHHNWNHMLELTLAAALSVGSGGLPSDNG